MPKIVWKQMKVEDFNFVPRSSHGVSVIGDFLYVFGGELKAREPIGPELWSLKIQDGPTLWAEEPTSDGTYPPPRYCHYNIHIPDMMSHLDCIQLFPFPSDLDILKQWLANQSTFSEEGVVSMNLNNA